MPEEEAPRRFWVKATDPERVGVWDRHPDLPGEEVFVAGDAVVEVAATPVVLDALAKGRIVEVQGYAQRRPPAEGAPAQPAEGGQAPSDAAKPARR